MKKLSQTISLLVLLTFSASGCSVFMAAKQPAKKDLTVLDKGTSRTEVIAEFGAPEWSGEKEGKTVDIFKFAQGYSKGAKVGRAFFHGAADIWTLGLWEVIGTPAEMIADGKNMKLEIVYDADDNVEIVNHLNTNKKKKKK